MAYKYPSEKLFVEALKSKFAGLDLAEQRHMHVLVVQAPLKRRVGQDDIEMVGSQLLEAFRKIVAQGVLVMDVRSVDAVEQQVHGGDAQHGHIEIESVEHAVLDVLFVRDQLISGKCFAAVFICYDRFR